LNCRVNVNCKFLVEADVICDKASLRAAVLRAGIKGALIVDGMSLHFCIKCSKDRKFTTGIDFLS
jgi:hypothetical protein